VAAGILAMSSVAFASPCDSIGFGAQLPSSQSVGPVLCNQFYAAQESLERREPIWSAEHLTAASVLAARALHGRGAFHEDDRLPFTARSGLDDYKRSGWARGHMTPSGDAADQEARYETFALSNVVPQDERMNSGHWEHIEAAVRRLAEADGDLYVVTGPAYTAERGAIGPHRLPIPTSVWKAVYDPAQRAVAIITCRNEPGGDCHRATLAGLEKATGVNPFPSLTRAEGISQMEMPEWIHEIAGR